MKGRSFLPVFAVLAMVAVGGGCRDRSRAQHSPSAEPRGEPSASPAAESAPATVASQTGGHVHDPAHPPIDCPLRKQGIDPTHMRPFEEVEEYITFLERPDRLAWQKPGEVVKALALSGTETVVDLGAGSGYFTFRFAKALPHGRVVAADTEAEMIRHIHHKAMTEGVDNIETKIVSPADPVLPPDADVVFVCDVLHHVQDRPAWLGKLAEQMKPEARFVLVEFKEGQLPEGPPEGAKIPRGEILRLATGAGFSLESEQKELLPYQVFLVFRALRT